MNPNIAIVSPSGKYYGSEQVLHDFLKTSRYRYSVFVPDGKFFDIINRDIECNVSIHKYTSIKCLYLKLFLKLLDNSFEGIYINEGGHSKYIKILAHLFPKKKFFIHIRLLEDCDASRINNLPSNVTLISISDYIADKIMELAGRKSTTILDVYKIRNQNVSFSIIDHTKSIRLGFVGRLTDTKGIKEIQDLTDYLESNAENIFSLCFFGDINKESKNVANFLDKVNSYKKIKCKFYGYVAGAENIYPNIDILVHLNKHEPLGRIAFESLDFGKPFIGFNSGGIGEIARRCGLSNYMLNVNNKELGKEFIEKISNLLNDHISISKFADARCIIEQICSPHIYTEKIEKLINKYEKNSNNS